MDHVDDVHEAEENDDSLLIPIKTEQSGQGHEKPHSSTDNNTGKKPYACKQCHQSYNYASNLSRHKLTIHEKKHSYACDQCYKIFNQMCHLKTHKSVVHDGVRSQVCQLCGKCYQNAPLLKRHLLTHTGLCFEFLNKPSIFTHFFSLQVNDHFHVNNAVKRLHKHVI